MTPSQSIELSGTIARLQDDLSSDGGPVTADVLSAWRRPFSQLARVELRSAGGTRRVIVKIPRCRPGRTDRRLQQFERECANASSLASIFAGENALGVAEVVAFYRDVPALVWAEVEGPTLASLAERLGRGIPGTGRLQRLETACRNAGRWLRVLQEATRVDRQQLSLQEMTDYVDIRLRRISELRPRRFGERWRAEVRRVFAEATLAPEDLRVAGIHGDYTLSNIMCSADRLVAIDLGRFGTGSVYYDVTRLYHQLGLLRHKPWYLPSTVARLRRALLDGFDRRVSPDQPVFQLHLIQHLLCHWLGVLKPATVPYHVRGYRRWTGLLHRRELAGLVARFNESPRHSYA